MAGAFAGFLWGTGRRAETEAVLGRAEVRSAFDDFQLTTRFRTRAAGVHPGVVLPGAFRPFPDVSSHVEQAVANGREDSDR